MTGCRRPTGDGLCGVPRRQGARVGIAPWCPACEPIYCTCAAPDPDVIDECRRCRRAVATAPRVADAIAEVALRFAPSS